MKSNLFLSIPKWIALGVLFVCSSICESQQISTVPSSQISSKLDVRPTKIKRIEPGTVIGNSAPTGWTYLLFKNQSSIGAGDMDAASDMLKKLASLFSSVMVANVVPNDSQTEYIFAEIGYGLYTQVGNENMIVSVATYKKLGAQLSLVQSMGLSQAESRLDQLSITARTESLVIVDANSTVLLNGKHQNTMVRHAILLNQQTGKVVTLVWFFYPDDRRKAGEILSEMDCIEPNSLVDVVLHLDKSEFSFGLPTEKALALNKMMWGTKQIALPQELQALGRLPVFNETALRQFEAGLRQVISP